MKTRSTERAARVIVLSLAILAVGSLVVAADPARIKVTWNANTEADLAGYIVYVNGAPMENVAAPTTECTYLPGRDGTFSFAVTAYDTNRNESRFSNEVTVIINPPPSPPTGCSAEVMP